MDQGALQDAPGPAGPDTIGEATRLAQHITTCLVSFTANKDMTEDSPFQSLGSSLVAGLHVMEEIKLLLQDGALASTIKLEGEESFFALAARLHRLCKGLGLLLIKAGTASGDEDKLGEYTDEKLIRSLDSRHLGKVIREGRHEWLTPRVMIYVDELGNVAMDLLLHQHVFRLAGLQMRRVQSRLKYGATPADVLLSGF